MGMSMNKYPVSMRYLRGWPRLNLRLQQISHDSCLITKKGEEWQALRFLILYLRVHQGFQIAVDADLHAGRAQEILRRGDVG